MPPLSPSYQEKGWNQELGPELDMGSAEIEADCEPYAKEMLAGAQSRHKIFHDELVVKAFFEAEKAHKGQVLFHFFFLVFVLKTNISMPYMKS